MLESFKLPYYGASTDTVLEHHEVDLMLLLLDLIRVIFVYSSPALNNSSVQGAKTKDKKIRGVVGKE